MRDRMLLPCPEALDRFALHLDGELGEADGRPLELHLEACPSCRDQARGLAEVHRDLVRRSALAEVDSRDPVPALAAKARWEKAVASRARRTTLASRGRDRRIVWLPFAVAAGIAAGILLVALAGHRPQAPRRAAPEAPAVALPVETPAPVARAPKRVEPPKVERAPILRHEPPPPPVVREAPVPPAPPPMPPARETEAASATIARVERTDGAVSFESGRATSAGVAEGETLVTRGAESRAVVAFPDGTRLHVGGETSITFAGGKSATVARGEVAADVAPQPRGQAMVFATPGAEVKVLGTWLAIVARPESTWVQVEKGRVQVTRRSDRWSIPVREGQYAVVEAGSLPVARPLPANLLADPGFESGGKGWGGIWNASQGRNYGGVLVTPDAPRALQLTTERTLGWDREVFQDFPAAPGETLEAAGWLKTEGVGGTGVRLSLVWLSSGASLQQDLTAAVRARGAVLREDAVGSLAGASGWVRLAARAVAPAGTRQVRMLLYVDSDPSGPANARFDDALLRRVPRAGR